MSIPQINSPAQSSPDSFEVDDDLPANPPSQWQSQHDQASPNGASSPASQQQPRNAAPTIQKRRRVTRACDECRRKKIKCDGKQPCTHCTVYSYDCTYDQPSNRRRNPAPQYIEALEIRLQRAEALLRTYNPSIDVNDPNLDQILQTRQNQLRAAGGGTSVSQAKVKAELPQSNTPNDAHLQSMIENAGQLDIDEQGYWDFHGGSSGTVFLKRLRKEFGGLLGQTDSTVPLFPKPTVRTQASNLESPRSVYESPHEPGLANTMDLPSRETARLRCTNALTCACALLRFVHQPSFYAMVDRIYDTPAEEFGDEENKFLPLLYAVLAVGCMFTEDPQPTKAGETAYQAGIDQGYKYFRAARQIIDVTECRDITSVQVVLFMIIFLQSASNLSTCYSYVGLALRSAIRMGLHRNISTGFNPIERETRRRVFWIIRKMDTYVSAQLGFPRLLSDEDIDQVLPLEVDDEFITKESILPMPEGRVSLYAASNAHTKLMSILAKVIKYIYPIKSIEQCAKDCSYPSYVISHAKIREVERDLQDWLDRLPMALRPGGYADEEMARAQQLLRMAYAHVQMMLYRPFLHYLSAKATAGKTIDDRSYACAAACISVSRNIVHITAEMKKRGLLTGAYWFTMYTTFFAILSLVFFVLENPDKAGSKEILADASAGRDALRGLARRSMAADRCTSALGGLFERLPEKLKRRNADSNLSKKKRPATLATPATAGDAHSTPDLAKSSSQTAEFGKIQRAATFPTPVNTTGSPFSRTSFDSPRYPQATLPNRHSQSIQDMVSPIDSSAAGTPESSASGSVQFGHQLQQPYFGNNNLPDLGAMMFPSADPFAYPNQPVIEFDNRQQNAETTNNFLEGSSVPHNVFLSNSTGGHNPYDNLEGQFFGPLPPYLTQSQANAGIDLTTVDVNGMHGVHQPALNGHAGFPATNQVGMNFDDIFVGNNEDWNSMLTEHPFRT